METYTHIIIKRSDGVPVNIRFEPVTRLRSARRFDDLEDYERFMTTGYYKPDNAALYRPQLIRITYEELEDEKYVREAEEPVSKD